MSRSHLSVRHLLKQIESDRSKRVKRDIRPEWLIALIEYAAELFEPLTGLGRVGFDCRMGEAGWDVALFLGAIELVGGKEDGLTQHVDFRFDLAPLLERFSRIDEVSWTVVAPPESANDSMPRSIFTLGGLVGESR